MFSKVTRKWSSANQGHLGHGRGQAWVKTGPSGVHLGSGSLWTGEGCQAVTDVSDGLIVLVSQCWCSVGSISGNRGMPSTVGCFVFLLQEQLSLPEGWEILLAKNRGVWLKRDLGTEPLSSFIKGTLWTEEQAYCVGF